MGKAHHNKNIIKNVGAIDRRFQIHNLDYLYNVMVFEGSDTKACLAPIFSDDGHAHFVDLVTIVVDAFARNVGVLINDPGMEDGDANVANGLRPIEVLAINFELADIVQVRDVLIKEIGFATFNDVDTRSLSKERCTKATIRRIHVLSHLKHFVDDV